MSPQAVDEPGPFHVHRDHLFDGFEILARHGGDLLVARCGCGAVLDVADARYDRCPRCAGATCRRCGGSGSVVDHAALRWRRPSGTEGRDAGAGQERA